MFPLLMIAAGVFVAGFVGVFAVRGVSNISSGSKGTSNDLKANDSKNTDKNENIDLGKNQNKDKQNIPGRENTTEKESEKSFDEVVKNVISAIRDFINEVKGIAPSEERSKMIDEKFSKMDGIEKKYLSDEMCKQKVTSVLEKQWEQKVNQTIQEAEGLISKIEQGANPQEVMAQIPEKPNFETFLNNSDELITNTVEKYKQYNRYVDERNKKIEENKKSGNKEQISDISLELSSKVEEPSVGVEEFTALVDNGLEKLKSVKADEIEEPQHKLTKEEALKRLNDYKEYINKGINAENKSIDDIINERLQKVSFADESNKNKELVADAMKTAWNSIVASTSLKVDSLINKVSKADGDFEKYVDKLPKIDYKWFNSKGCSQVVNRVNEKYKLYFELVKELAPNLQSVKNSDDPEISKIEEYVFNVLNNIEKRIVSSKVSVELFSIDLEREALTLKNEFNNINRFSNIKKDIENLKSFDKDIEDKMKHINDTLIEHSDALKKINDVDLQEMRDKIYELAINSDMQNKQIINLWKSLAQEMSTRSREVSELKDDVKKSLRMVKNALEKKADIGFVSEELKVISENLKALSVVDLLSLSKAVKSLQDDFDKVEENSKKIVEREIEGLEDKIKDFARKSIAVRIGQKMKALEVKNEKDREKMLEEIMGKIESSQKTLTEEEINKIVDTVINGIKVVKK